MVISFERIILNNFASFKHAELDLSDMGYTLISGRNYCKLDNAYSNGSGKSSIFNGLCFALTGETTQGISTGVENIFADPNNCWVELQFSVDSDKFIVRRFKTPKHDMKISINGVDRSGKGIKESTKLLQQYVPDLTPKFIGSVVLLGLGMPNRFSNNNPAQRKEILESLTKSDFMIAQIKDKLENRLLELKQQLRTNEDSLLSIKSLIEVYNKQIENLNDQINNFKSDDILVLNLNLQLYKELLSNTTSLLTDKQSELDSLYDLKSKLSSEYKVKLDSELESVDKDLLMYTDKMATTKADIKSLTNEIKKLESITDICPTCGLKIPGVLKSDTTEQNNSLLEYKQLLDELTKTVSKLTSDKKLITEKYNNEFSIKDKQLNYSIYELSTAIKNYRYEIDNINTYVNDLVVKIQTANNAKDNYNKLLSDLMSINETVKTLDDSCLVLDSNIININARLNVILQMITLAKREFRGVLLLNVIEFINKKVKVYSKEVFGNTELSFSLNENCIDITYCDKLYENLSGGEKLKIDIVIQLALRDILSKQLNLKTNLLVCDEVLDNIDSVGAEKIINIIQNQGDIDSIFFITHHSDLLNMSYDRVITVEKNTEGISKILV